MLTGSIRTGRRTFSTQENEALIDRGAPEYGRVRTDAIHTYFVLLK